MEEGDLERQKKVEAGREKFAAYKKKKNSSNQSNEQKKKTKVDGEEEKAEKDGVAEAAGAMALGVTSVLHSDEEESRTADTATLQHYQDRVKELEDILAGKDVALEVAKQEVASDVEAEYKEQVEECRKRLVEFQAVVEQRDNLIHQLSSSLQQAIASRDALQLKGEHLADEVALLQRQLQATSELVQGHKSQDYLSLQNKMLAVESTVQKHIALIERLQKHLADKDEVLHSKETELERKSQELAQHKTQSAMEVQQLMREVEELHQRAAAGAAMQHEHEKQLAAQRAELEESFGLQLSQIKEEILFQCHEEKAILAAKHREELEAVVKKTDEENLLEELELYKKQAEDLSQQLVESSSVRESLSSELSSYRSHVEENPAHRAELVSYEQQLASLISEHKLCKAKSEELEVCRQSYTMEVNALQDRISSLTTELQKVSEIAENHLLQLEQLKTVHETEITALKQTHEAELEFLNEQLISVQTQKWQVDQLNKQLQEKTKTEEKLKCELQTVQQELINLKRTNEMQSYMQQIDVMNAELRAESLCLGGEVSNIQFEGTASDSSEVLNYKYQLDLLNTQLQEKAKIEEKLKHELEAIQVELVTLRETSEHQSLTLGPIFEEKLDTEISEEMLSYKKQLDILNSQYQEKAKSEEALRNELLETQAELVQLKQSNDVNFYKQQLDALNTQLQERNKTEEKLKDELQLARGELKKLEVVLQERLKTEENLLCKLGEHKQEIDILNSRVLELSLRANQLPPLEAEIQQLQHELEVKNSYIRELEIMKEQGCESLRIKDELMNELTLSVKSLKEDDAHYKEQLLTIHRRLDEETHTADDNLVIRESYESEISKYQQQIISLNARLQDTVKAEEEHLEEICARQSELNGYKTRLEALNSKFTEELTRVQLKYSEEISSNNLHLETLKQEASETKNELKKCKEEVQGLSKKLQEASKRDEEYILHLAEYKKDIDSLNKQLEESLKLQEEYKNQISSYSNQLDVLNTKIQETEERHSRELVSYKHTIDALESEILSHEEQMKLLNHSLESACNALNSAETCSKEYHDRLTQAEQTNQKIVQEKLEAEKAFLEKTEILIEKHNKEMSSKSLEEKALQVKIEQLSLSQKDYLLKIENSDKTIQELNSELCEKRLVIENFEKELITNQRELQDTKENLKLLDFKFKDEIKSLNEQIILSEESFRKDKETLQQIHMEETGDLKMQIESLQNELKHMSESKNENSKDCHLLREEQGKLQQLLLEKEYAIQTSEEQITNLKAEVLCVEQHKRDLEEKLQKELHSCKTFEEQVRKLTEDMEHLKEEKTNLYNELKKDRVLLEEKSAGEKCFLSDIESLTREIEHYKSQYEEAQDSLKELASVHQSCISKKEELHRNLSELLTKLSDKDSALRGSEEQVIKYQSELVQAEANTEHYIITLKEEIENLKNNRKDIEKSHCSEIEKLVNDHKRELDVFLEHEMVLKEQLNELLSSHENCRQEIEDYCKKIDEIKCKLTEKDSIIIENEKHFANLNSELLQTKELMKSMDDKLQQERLIAEEAFKKEIQKISDECNQSVASYKQQEEVLLSQLSELTITHQNSLLVIEEYQKKLDDSNNLLAEQNATIESYSRHISECQMDLNKKKDEMKSLEIKFHEELTSVKNELEHMKTVCKAYEEEIATQSNRSVNPSKQQAPLAELDEMNDSTLMNNVNPEKLGNDSIDNSDIKSESELSLSERICDLETNMKALNEQCLKQRASLEEKIAAEKVLQNRVVELEGMLASQEVNYNNANLSELSVRYLKVQSLLSGKEEIEQVLGNRIAELEKSSQDATENSRQLKQENLQLSLKIVKAKELLKKLKAEREEAKLKCRGLEAEREQLLTEKQATEKLVEELKTEVCNLQHKITSSSDPISTMYSDIQFVASLNSSEPNDLSNDRGSGDASMPRKIDAIDDSSALNLLKWMEQCKALEHEKKELVTECEALKTRLEEREIHERLFNEDMLTAQSRCEKLEKRLSELEKCESTIEKLIQMRVEMEFKLEKLESENKILQETEFQLSAQLVEIQLEYEKKLQQCLQDQFLKNNSDEKVEDLILELNSKSKELIVLKEQLKCSEYQFKKLNNNVKALEKSKGNAVKQFELFHNEVAKMRARLEEAWQEHESTEKELGHARKELVLLQLRQSQLETSQSRLLDSSYDMSEHSILSLQRDVHHMVEDLVAEVFTLKQSLQAERCRSEQLACELKSTGLRELQQKLEEVLQSNKELLSEKEMLKGKLQKHSDSQEGAHTDEMELELENQHKELMEQLAAYRNRHTSLAEILGGTGILQETLRCQKEELIFKLQEKLEIEQKLEAERAILKQTQLKLQLLEQQMIEKDNIQMELQRQKSVLEANLRDIEERLRDQVDCLQSQKLELEAQIRNRDIHIRKCKLQVQAKELERDIGNLPQGSENEDTSLVSKEGEVSQKLLEALRMELDEAHSKALARLRQHLNEQFTIRETVLQEKFTSELQTQHAVHQEQLAVLQKELVEKTRKLKNLAASNLHKQLGANGSHVEDFIALKEKHECELENIRTGLEEGQVQLYALLKHKFESFAEQQVSYALNKLSEEHEQVLEKEVSALVKHHRQELSALRARLENGRLQELLEVRQELSRQHTEELEALKLVHKESQPARIFVTMLNGTQSSHAMLNHLKKFLYNEYVTALKELTKVWMDSWSVEETKIDELVEAMETDVPVPGTLMIADIEQEGDMLDRWEKMLLQLQELQKRKLATYEEAMLHIEAHLDAVHNRIAERIKEIQQTASLSGLQSQVEQLAEQRDKHRLAVELLSNDHTSEVEKMKELVTELEGKHAKEMEELRRYFEQKVAEVEKHYSEEIVSQHSRRLSGSSCGSDNELVADMYYGSGDIGPRISTITHICDSYAVEPSYKDLEEHYRTDFEKRLMEYRDQLETVKQELEKKYEGELLAVRNEYETKMERLVKELSSNHLAEIQNIEAKHIKEIENMKAKWRDEMASLGAQDGEPTSSKKTQVRHIEQQTDKIEGKPEVFEEELIWTLDAQQKALTSKSRATTEENKTLLELQPEGGSGDMKARQELDQSHQSELISLKATYEQLLQEKIAEVTAHMEQQEQEHLAALKKDLEEKHSEELKILQSLYVERSVDELGTKSAEAALHIVHREQALRQEIRCELEQELEQKVEELTTLLKSNAEKEQALFIEAQNEIMKEFLEKNKIDPGLLKAQADERLPFNIAGAKLKLNKETQTFLTQLTPDKLLQQNGNGSSSDPRIRVSEEYQADIMKVVPQILSESSAEPGRGKSPAQQPSISSVEDNSAESANLIAAAKPKVFLVELSKLQDAHAADLHALQTTWLDVLGRLIQGAEPVKEMKRLKETFITDCAAKFQLLLEDLRVIYKSEIEEKEKVFKEFQVNQEQKALLAADQTTPRPQELVLLEEKLVSPYIEQLKALQEEHQRQKAQLKEEHEKKLTQKSETSFKELKEKSEAEMAKIIKERDQWKKMGTALRNIVEELMHYLVVCEDELNDTILGELGVDDSVPEVSKSDNESKGILKGDGKADESEAKESNTHDVNKTAKQARRVHFAPSNNVHLINLINEESLLSHLEQDDDLPANFRSELNSCVERLKTEVSAVIGLSTSDNAEARQEKTTVFLKEELKLAKKRLAELESERATREIVTEGFGEHIQSGLSHRLENLAQLQDKARTVLSKRSSSPEDAPYLQLLEEICHEGDRLTEEARREREDLQQQVSLATSPMTHSACCQKVDAADKQLRATRQFLEDQAAEREQERDEFVQEVNRLQEIIREREKELLEQQRIAKEVEALELQGKEALALQQETISQKEHLESELKEAVDKIWILREIITELEGQVENKSKRVDNLEHQLQEMRDLLAEQTNTHQQLADELESVRSEMGAAELLRHVAHLEDQLMRHRQQMEQLQPDSAAVNQMKSQLRELETALEKRTKDLESLHVTPSSASCSSPSEDVSIREQMEVFRCATPDEMRSSPGPASSPAILPMEELQRLQEKLQRHSRAEEAALKRIRDLEMQLRAARRSEEEVVAERDVLHERVEEQLLKISSLQARVDQQRRKVENEQSEEVVELQNKLRSKDKHVDQLQGLIELREREIKKLNSTVQRIKDALVAQEAEWSTRVAKEHEVVQQLQQQCHRLQDLYDKQQSKRSSRTLEHRVPIPVLFESLLAEKNAEIDELQQKLQVMDSKSSVTSRKVDVVSSYSDRALPSIEEEDILRHTENLSSELLPDSVGPIFQKPATTEHSNFDAKYSNLGDLEKQLHKKEAEIKWLKSLTLDRLNSFLREIELLKENQELLPSLQEDLLQVTKQLRETISTLSDEDGKILQQEKEQLVEQLHEAKRLCQENQELLLQVDVQGKEKDELIIRKQDEIEELCTETNSLRSQLKDLIELQAEVKALHQEKTLNAQQFDKQLENMVLLRKEIERLGKVVCEKDEVIQTLQQKLTDSIREKDTIVMSLKGELQDKLSEKDELVKALQTELKNLMKEHESKVNSLNKEREQLVEQLRALEEAEQAGSELYRQMSEHLSATLREKEQAQTMVDALRTELETEQAAAEEQRSAVNVLQAEVESLKTKLAESQDEFHASTKALKEEVTKLQEENNSLLADAGPIDDLTGKVQTELDLSAKLDSTLLDHLSPFEDEEDPFKFPAPKSMNLTDILNKVMEFGMDALSFRELSFLHQETCTASSGMLKTGSAAGSAPIDTNNEQQIRQQITELKGQLAVKEQVFNERVNGLEVAVEHEKKHNAELQTALSAEQRRNGELHNRVGAQARLQADLEIEKDLLKQQLSYHEDRLKQLSTLLEQERLKAQKLDDDLQRERNNVKQLQSLLETERQRARAIKIKDSELLEAMRLKLEKALDSEARLRFQVEQAKKEIPFTSLSVPVIQESKEKSSTPEAGRLRLETEQLRAEIALLRNHKESLEIQLTTAHNQLSSRQAEIDMMRRKVRGLQEAELRHQRHYANEREEIIEKARAQKLYLEQQVQDLEHRLTEQKNRQPQLANELEELQQAHVSVLQELAATKVREEQLNQELTRLRENESSPRVTEPFLEKLKNMNAALDQHVKDNNEVALTLARLVEERQTLHTRIHELQDRLTTAQANEAASKAACATLVQEKAALQLALAQCKVEAASGQRSLADDDMDNRVRHLFGKYLRAESYRKALTWQKRYLLVALGGYQETEATTLSRLAQLAGEPEGEHCRRHHKHRRSARTRFKSAVIVVVAIHRMKYLVQRWYHGRNIGGSTVLNRAYSESLFSGRSSYRGPRRHAGSAASSGSWGLPSSAPRVTSLLSPPSRDQPMLRRWQSDRSQQQWRSTETSPSPTHFQPNRVTEYVERFDELQQRLGLSVVPPHQKT